MEEKKHCARCGLLPELRNNLCTHCWLVLGLHKLPTEERTTAARFLAGQLPLPLGYNGERPWWK